MGWFWQALWGDCDDDDVDHDGDDDGDDENDDEADDRERLQMGWNATELTGQNHSRIALPQYAALYFTGDRFSRTWRWIGLRIDGKCVKIQHSAPANTKSC